MTARCDVTAASMAQFKTVLNSVMVPSLVPVQSSGCPALSLPPTLWWLIVQLLQVRKLLQHEHKLLQKYEEKLLDSYIEDNRSVRWCPSVPHCGCAIQVG